MDKLARFKKRDKWINLAISRRRGGFKLNGEKMKSEIADEDFARRATGSGSDWGSYWGLSTTGHQSVDARTINSQNKR